MRIMIKTLAVVSVIMLVASFAMAQVTIHNWNFNVGTPASGQQWPTPVPATTGTGSLTHNFTDVQSFTGSLINAEPGDLAGGCFATRAANGQTFTLAVPTTGYQGPTLTYATQRTATGFTTQTIEYSLDGTTFLPDTAVVPSTVGSFTLITVSFASISGAGNNPNFAIRFTLSGSTSTSGNNRFDNVKITGFAPLNDGDGAATLQDSTAGIYHGSTIFPRATAGQTVSLSVTGTPAGLLDQVQVNIPSTWSGFNSSNVTLAGAFAGKTMTFGANSITIQSAALGTAPGYVTITSLTSPNPNGPLVSGNDSWVIHTAKVGGSLTAIAHSPVSYTVIPIRNLRTGGVDGYGNTTATGDTSALRGQTVVVSGVATVQNNIISSTTTQTSFFIQDGSYGLQVFKTGAPVTTWVRGDQMVVKGIIDNFGGATEIVPASGAAPDFFNLGAGALPTPQVLANASAVAESVEARLVKLNTVNWVSAGQTFADTVSLGRGNFTSAPGDTGTIYISSTNPITHSVIPVSSQLEGIVYDRKDLTTGGARPYKIAPRDFVDLGSDPASGTGSAVVSPLAQFSNQTNKTEAFTIKGNGVYTLSVATITIPSTWTWTDTSLKSVSGPGMLAATLSVSGDGSSGNPYVVRVLGAAMTATDSGIVSISGLSTPSTLGLTTWTVRTGVALALVQPVTPAPTVNIVTGFSAVASGNWSNPATWAGNVVPTASDDVNMSTLHVVVTVDIANAVCNNLAIAGSGSDTTGGGSGPVLAFAATGTPQLTVNGNLSISGGSGGGSGNRGGRGQLTSNGNSGATLIVKRSITTTSSNTTANGNAGLNMNEGTVKLNGATTDSISIGAGFRLANLVVGDGSTAKTLSTYLTSASATMTVRSLTVKQLSTFKIGSAVNSNYLSIGNIGNTGVPTLTGGITVETGASLVALDSATTNSYINLFGGGITNSGTLNLINATTGRAYTVRIDSTSQTIGGTNAATLGNVTLGANQTLTLNQRVNVGAGFAMTVNGTLAETAGHTVFGTATATRTVAATSTETFGGIGLELVSSATAPGSTVVTRVTGVASVGGSSSSILRYFDINPTTNAGLAATLRYFYDDTELAGQTAATLQLWRSEDAGSTWAAAGGTVNTTLHSIQLAGVDSLSRWTASDASHPLSGSSTLNLNIALLAGWNLISNPLTNPIPGDSVRQMYPTALNAYAFEFAGGYVQRFRLANGKGYWEKFPTAISQQITGTARTRDSITVAAGWNMVGSISNPVDTSTIVTVPPGLKSSNWFRYAGGYTIETQLQPGKGYWIKSTGAGKFVLANPLVAAPKTSGGVNVADMLNSITITDAQGNAQTLYFGADANHAIPVEFYGVPPAPPAGAFDARFEAADGGSMVRTHAAKVSEPVEYTIAIQSVAYPLTVSWNVTNGTAAYALADGMNGKAFATKEIAGQGSMKVANSGVAKLNLKLVGDGTLPADFALNQNYPNPFNPTTSIRYALPVESKLTMDVFNVLGQRVRTLVNDNVAAGYHAIEWNGTNNAGQQLASGVYFVQMSAKGANGKTFSDVRKLMMLK